MVIDLIGKVCLVTGVGRGIGRVIARTLAGEGAVVAGADIDRDTLADWDSERCKAGWRGLAQACDVRVADETLACAEAVVSRFGRIDALVNNAGVCMTGSLASLTEGDWDLNQDTNLKGVFLMCRAVAPAMKRQRAGRIINAASFAAIVPALHAGSYAASKAGVHYLTRALAGELAPWNVTVNCYAPGMVPTGMNHFTELPAERQERLLDTLTIRRWGDARDVASLVCFLASDLASYITGAMIDVSGGKLATQMPEAAYAAARAADDTL